jgi:hypothetical protein
VADVGNEVTIRNRASVKVPAARGGSGVVTRTRTDAGRGGTLQVHVDLGTPSEHYWVDDTDVTVR